MKQIQLTQGKVAMVDDSDHDLVSKYKWHADTDGYNWYAKRRTKSGHQRMHIMLMEPPPGVVIDHRDGNGLNNQRQNLRIGSMSQNQANRRMIITNKSGLKGVSWKKKNRRWCAQIRVGKVIHLGLFIDKFKAAMAYDDAAIRYFGEFALTNKMLGLIPLDKDFARQPVPEPATVLE